MEALNKEGLIQFVEMITQKGWINPNTGGGWKAAVTKILSDVDATEDVRKIDVSTAIRRYNNLHPGELAPASLLQYEKRVKIAIDQYVSYVTDPTKYKAPARPLTAGTPKKILRRTRPTTPDGDDDDAVTDVTVIDMPPAPPRESKPMYLATETNLVMPFPLRPDYLAQIVIPRDLKKDEADRLCAFIQSLATA